MHSFSSDIFLLGSEEKAYGDYLSGLYIEIQELRGRIVNGAVMSLFCNS